MSKPPQKTAPKPPARKKKSYPEDKRIARGQVRLQLRVPAEAAEQLRELAGLEQLPQSEVVTRLIGEAHRDVAALQGAGAGKKH